APGANRRRRLFGFSLSHRVPPTVEKAELAQVFGGARNRRRQLPERHLSGGQGGRTAFRPRRSLQTASREQCRMSDIEALLGPIRRLHESIRDAVVAACERTAPDQLASIDRDDEGDTIYAVDRVSEDLLIDFIEREICPMAAVVLIAEGLHGGKAVLP